MTTMDQSERACSVCGKKSKQTAIMSSNQFGSPDLDLRPPEMMRSTMAYWVEECPHCHYAYPSIETKVEGVEALLIELAQMEASWTSRTRGLIRRFMTASHIAEAAGQKMEAADYALNAAWDADDSQDDVLAREFRRRAASLLEHAVASEDLEVDEKISHLTRLVDIMRRSQSWDVALELATSLLMQNPSSPIDKILEFQIEACRRHDAACYKISDVVK
jgi:hypothetical protein